MSSLYSPSLKLELMGTGDQSGLWGGTTNTNLGTALEQAIVGKASLVTGDFTANVATLTLLDTNASQTARAFVLDVTATLSAAGTINVPAVQKPYIVFNNTVGGFALTIKVAGLTGVVVPNGKRMLVYNNGTDIIDGLNYLNGTAISATTAINLASGVANNIPYQTSAGATSFITAPSTPGYVLGWTGSAFSWVVAPAATTAVSLVGGTAGALPYQSATSNTAFTAAGTTGQSLLSGGTNSPTWGAVDLSTGVTGLLPLGASVSGVLPIANGGTNSTATATAGGVGYGTGTAHAYTAVGTSGQYLQSAGASAPIWATLFIAGIGGTTSTASITLTASSPATMTVTPATPGLYVTLPVATTCTKADNLYSVYNAGDYDYGVKDSTGTQLGWIRARTGAMIGLADNSSAAGVWAYYGLEKTGITASYVNSTLSNMGSTLQRIAVDSNRACFLFGGTDCYAIMYDASTQTWGSATLVRSGVASGAFLGTLSATNQVLVVSNDSSTGMQTVTLTIATNTVTVNTPVNTTLTNPWAVYGQLIAVGSSWVVSYNNGLAASIRAITVSGTVPTIGAESALSTNTNKAGFLFASGSIVRTLNANTAGSGFDCIPYTVSGSTLTVGTKATALTLNTTQIRAFLNGNGNIVCHYINTTHYAAIFKLTGTTEAASSVSLGTAPGGTIVASTDYQVISSAKTLFITSSTSSSIDFNILTDSAGTATAGTPLSYTTNVGSISVCSLFTVGTDGYMGFSNSNGTRIYGLACSGASPTLLSDVQCPTFTVSASNSYGVKSPNYAFFGTSKMTTLSPATYNVVSPLWSTQSTARNEITYGTGGGNVSDGATGRFASGTDTRANSVGIGITRVEAAA